jgi:hypothetical protein
MPYLVNIKEEKDYIRVEVSGDRTPNKETEDAISVWSRVAERCHSTNIHRILATVDLSGRFPTLAAYELAKSPGAFGWERHFKMAVVDINKESRQDNYFTETVAVNRGYWVKIFDNEKDAENWLFES